MNFIASKITEKRDERKVFKNAPLFVPGGQSTQLIVGATQDHDINILRLSENLYKNTNLKEFIIRHMYLYPKIRFCPI